MALDKTDDFRNLKWYDWDAGGGPVEPAMYAGLVL